MRAKAEGQLALFDGEAEATLLKACAALGAAEVGRLDDDERALLQGVAGDPTRPQRYAPGIEAGEDPLGELFAAMRPADVRRSLGATYTPQPIVEAVLAGLPEELQPVRVVDPGVGSGRFLVTAGRRYPHATLVGVDIDPIATLMTRAHLAAAGLSARAVLHRRDYCTLPLERVDGPTLFVGNPPYVRHHLLPRESKAWLTREAKRLGLAASQLAGLHVHFFLATLLKGRPGDFGAFLTSSEWLDVNYGKLVRDLLAGPLGGRAVVVVEPAALPFPDAATTAAITYFRIGEPAAAMRFARVSDASKLPVRDGGRVVGRDRLVREARWMHFTRTPVERQEGYVELGELCRVHRGTVTGANRVWIAGEHSQSLPASCLHPTVTRARELLLAGAELADASGLKKAIDLPADLDCLEASERAAVDAFLRYARSVGADAGFIARHRRAWWSIGLRQPAPILATYMARRPPAFVRNTAGARHLNIAHGLYPRQPLTEAALAQLAEHLTATADVGSGRTYAGGLTKFEPREMERLLVPDPAALDLLGAGR